MWKPLVLKQHLFLVLIFLFAPVGPGCQKTDVPKETKTKTTPTPTAESQKAPANTEGSNSIDAVTLAGLKSANDYVTSAACRECHSSQHSSWETTYHRTMTQEATPGTVLGNFDSKMVKVGGYPCMPVRQGDKFFMTVVHPGWDDQEIKEGRDPQATDLPPAIIYSVDRVIGSHHQQVYLSRGEDGAYHTLPVVWNVLDKRWTTRKASFLAEPKPNFYHNTKLWNNGCIFCHNTGPDPGMELKSLDGGKSRWVWNSKVAELGIACEACHGPGGGHVQLEQKIAKSPGPQPVDALIVNPRKLSKVESVLTCARCHGKMIAKKEFDHQCLTDGDFFKPGEWEFVKRYDSPSRDESKEFDESGDGKYFWKDGTPRTTALEYQGTLLSPCYQQGEMTCLSCHSMHNAPANDQLLFGDGDAHSITEQNRACTQCHKQFNSDDLLKQHTRHDTNASGSLCYNCHMPFQAYSLLKRIRSHRISTPTATETATSGIPNACNQCHVDQSLEWTNATLATWSGKTPSAMLAPHPGLSSTVADAIAGNALQRALAIEQLGARENFELSGTQWRARLLLESLDDNYDANRYLAFRALVKMPGYESFQFDYIAPESERSSQIRKARKQWDEQETEPIRNRLKALLGGDTSSSMDELIQKLKNQRANVPVLVLE